MSEFNLAKEQAALWDYKLMDASPVDTIRKVLAIPTTSTSSGGKQTVDLLQMAISQIEKGEIIPASVTLRRSIEGLGSLAFDPESYAVIRDLIHQLAPRARTARPSTWQKSSISCGSHRNHQPKRNN